MTRLQDLARRADEIQRELAKPTVARAHAHRQVLEAFLTAPEAELQEQRDVVTRLFPLLEQTRRVEVVRYANCPRFWQDVVIETHQRPVTA